MLKKEQNVAAVADVLLLLLLHKHCGRRHLTDNLR